MMKWHWCFQVIGSGEHHALGPFLYWEMHRGKGQRWGRVAVGLSLLFWDIELEFSTDDSVAI